MASNTVEYGVKLKSPSFDDLEIITDSIVAQRRDRLVKEFTKAGRAKPENDAESVVNDLVTSNDIFTYASTPKGAKFIVELAATAGGNREKAKDLLNNVMEEEGIDGVANIALSVLRFGKREPRPEGAGQKHKADPLADGSSS